MIIVTFHDNDLTPKHDSFSNCSIVVHHNFEKRNTDSISISNNSNELSKSYKNVHFQVTRVIRTNFIGEFRGPRGPHGAEKKSAKSEVRQMNLIKVR